MKLEVFIIIALCLLFLSFLIYYILEKKKKINDIFLETDIHFENILKNHEKWIKHLEDTTKRLHNLNYEITEAYKKLNIKNKDYTHIKFDTDIVSRFEDSQRLNINEVYKNDKNNPG